MEDQIITLLKNSELRGKICQLMTEVYKKAGTFYDDPEYMKTLTEEGRFNEAWVDAQVAVEGQAVDCVFFDTLFNRHVFNKVPLPHRIHHDEVVEILFDMAKPDARGSLCHDCEYTDSTYASFVNYVNNHELLNRYSTAFPVCTILGGETVSVKSSGTTQTQIIEQGGHDSVSNGKKQQGIYEGTFWSNENGVCLRLVGKRRFESRFRIFFTVMAQITGRMSEAALKALSEEFERILLSMWKSVEMLEKTSDEFDLDTTASCILTASSILKVPIIDESNLPVVSEAGFESGRLFIQKCIDAYFSTPTKKERWGRRIRNAIHLLIASDAQSDDAVSLALSVAAIEALLGQKGEGISHRLSDNVGTLLEPEPTRRQEASKFFKELYHKRSRVLHGEQIDDCGHVRHEGRQLAAAVLHGIITSRDFLPRIGQELKEPDEFIKGLYEKRFVQGQPDGLWDSNVRKLWR